MILHHNSIDQLKAFCTLSNRMVTLSLKTHLSFIIQELTTC